MNVSENKKCYLFNFSFNPRNNQITVLCVLLGLFLFPKLAQLSTLSPEKIIELTNKERVKLDYKPLIANQFLAQAAAEKARAIFKNQTFQHDIGGRKFSAWIKDTGYNYIYAGENLAINFNTSEGVIDAWLNSPLHRKNLINSDFEEIGVAIVSDVFNGRESNLVVQIFGTPLFKVSRLMPTSYDLTFETLYGVNNMPNGKLLTHTASRYLSGHQEDPGYYPHESDLGEVNKLFEQLGLNPGKITDVFYLAYMVLISSLLILYYKLMVRHYKLKM